MSLYVILLATLFMTKNLKASESISCSKKLDIECGVYCHQIVRPLLSYAASVKSMEQQFVHQNNKIQLHEMTIKNLNEFINQKEFHLVQQIELSTLLNNSLKLQQKHLELTEEKVENLIELKEAQTEKIKELETELLKCQDIKIVSNCLGKLNDLHTIQLKDSEPFVAPCDSKLAESGWLVIQRRVDATVDFNRTWNEYRAGFGDLKGSFFIGLEKLYLLLRSQHFELYIYLKDFKNRTVYAKYSHFVIGNETDLYELRKLGNYSGNAGDSLKLHMNMKFSTADKNNSCAFQYQSGWWFNNCYSCNLNGLYNIERNELDYYGIQWFTWKLQSLKFVQIMIRPKLI